MDDSILNKTKKALGLDKTYTAFDPDIILHINSVFSTLNQLGVGPLQGYQIEDADPTWSDYLENSLILNSVQSYMYLRVRLLFDPPATSFALDAMKEQIKELEWRINVAAESEVIIVPVDPVIPPDIVQELADDGHPDGFVDGQSFDLIYQNAKG